MKSNPAIAEAILCHSDVTAQVRLNLPGEMPLSDSEMLTANFVGYSLIRR